MQHRHRANIEIAIAIVLALLVASVAIRQALGEDVHPAFGSHHTSNLSLDSEVPDIQKLEAKAVEVLRAKYGLTLSEARAKVRIDGKTDVARCLEFVIINALAGITQANVTASVVAEAHPVSVAEQHPVAQ